MDNLAAAMERDRRRPEILRCIDGAGALPRCHIDASLRSHFDKLWQSRIQRSVDVVITARTADFLE